MKRDIKMEAFYPYPPERVWRAVADGKAMAKWLMPNDFEPKLGHKFQFRTKPAPGFDGIVHCEVLELQEPRLLRISWRGGPIDTVLKFLLEPVQGGTKLSLEHTGFTGVKGLMISYMMSSGWKKMFRTSLPAVIKNIDRLDELPQDLKSCDPETV
ncbi:MAG TPA: SRPBCC domain-containing protein [Pyrinomonadaceae bacterium]|nr:SRPBCC domain-containing protein [Pyrinomonadaceae bacterium]